MLNQRKKMMSGLGMVTHKDSELEEDSLVKTIREKLVSKLCSTPVNTSRNLFIYNI